MLHYRALCDGTEGFCKGLNPWRLNAETSGTPGVERRRAVSRRVRRVNVVGLVKPTRMQETEAFREGEGVKAVRIQERMMVRKKRLHYVMQFDI